MNLVTHVQNFYHSHDPRGLVESYGSPVYIYNERIFRLRCQEMKSLCAYPNFRVNYAAKTNTNLTLLKIAHEEGLCIDVSSAGEVVAAETAGFPAEKIMFIVNNVSADELMFAIDRGLTVSVDSLSQLETFGRINPGGEICLRFNAGVGGGHHQKVVTGGDGTKFGIVTEYIPQVKELLAKHDLKLVGINHHVGSLVHEDLYLKGVAAILDVARQFNELEFIDLGGGFATPYRKQEGEKPIDLQKTGQKLDEYMHDFAKSYGKDLTFIIEPGRFITAECGVLLGTVNVLKDCGKSRYAGTDIGFSVFPRPTLYDSHHDIEIYRENNATLGTDVDTINIVGNQCESGDYVARQRVLPKLQEGDVLGMLDSGAYCYSLSSQYNHRQRPAEVLIQTDGTLKLIRKRDTFEDIIQNMVGI